MSYVAVKYVADNCSIVFWMGMNVRTSTRNGRSVIVLARWQHRGRSLQSTIALLTVVSDWSVAVRLRCRRSRQFVARSELLRKPDPSASRSSLTANWNRRRPSCNVASTRRHPTCRRAVDAVTPDSRRPTSARPGSR